MLIQCHSCNTKYRLNLEQIPRRKTFVRCKNCGTPIYIDPTEEEQPAAGVIAPAPAPGAEGPAVAAAQGEDASGQVLLVCPGCSARYRIAAESVRRPGVKLKCTQCGHLFAPPPHLQPPQPARPAPTAPPPAGEAMGAPPQRPAEMPLPDEQHMEHMFDDLRPEPVEQRVHIEPPPGPAYPRDTELGSLAEAAFEEEAPAPDADSAYLDAVALDEEGGAMPAAGTVPDTQKYQFFLNPKEFHGSDKGMADQPDEKDELATPGGFEPEGEPAAPAADEGPELPPPGEHELPPMPVPQAATSREEMAKIREVVPGQEARSVTEKRVLTLVAAAAVVILVATGAWGYWLASTSGERRPFRMQVGQPHQLALQEDLQGHYVANKASGRRLFVVNGEVENRFGAGATVRWIRIKGLAYADPNQTDPLDTTFAYAGNVLDDDQLSQWELPAIKAYYGFIDGRKDLNVAIPSGAKVPYQLVFSEAKAPVGRTIAQIVSYHLDGQAVFIDNP